MWTIQINFLIQLNLQTQLRHWMENIRIRNPSNIVFLCYNYQKYFSISLLASVDATIFFVIVVGAHGYECDSAVFNNSNMKKRFSTIR